MSETPDRGGLQTTSMCPECGSTAPEPHRCAVAATKYGTAEHAAVEAIVQSIYNSDGWVTAEAASIADVVVAGLRARGFAVHREARCECGWTGEHNHYHDARMGRANA